MAIFARLRPVPSHIQRELALERGERALAYGVGDGGEWYAGTDRALYLKTDSALERIGWEQIERADWQREQSVLAIVEIADWGEPEERREIRLADAGPLLELLRERVTKSVVINLFAPVSGRRGLSVVGRRSPTGRGPIAWSYVLSEGLDPADPEVQETADRTLATARAEVDGLPDE